MFMGCPNKPGPDDDDDDKDVNGEYENLLGKEFVGSGWAEEDGAQVNGAWYYHSAAGSIENVDLGVGKISWKATLGDEPDEDDEDAEWPYAEMCVATGGFLGEEFKIYLTYTSDRDIEFGLLDGSPAGNEGAGYAAALKKGTDVKVTLDKSKFKQPSWAKDDGLTYTLDLNQVEGFSFSAGENYGRSVNVTVTRFEVEELFWEDDE